VRGFFHVISLHGITTQICAIIDAPQNFDAYFIASASQNLSYRPWISDIANLSSLKIPPLARAGHLVFRASVVRTLYHFHMSNYVPLRSRAIRRLVFSVMEAILSQSFSEAT
jgi:hypothetical protein